MSDNSYLTNRVPRIEPSPVALIRDGGYEAASALRLLAVLSIGARLFLTYASANRISVVHSILVQVPADTPVVNGKFDLTGRPGAADVIAQAHDADGLVVFAWVVTIIMLILFLVALSSVHRRRKRDTLAAAIDRNRAVRFAGRLYLIPTVGSGAAQSAFKAGPHPTPLDQLHRTSHIDVTNIVLQMFVLAFLLLIALATHREMRDATAVPRAE
ncbi:MAG: hypothetical protein HOW97_39510 [Catenulispora sp.]|nr:hypothetical protein [Catenulispora sp.]